MEYLVNNLIALVILGEAQSQSRMYLKIKPNGKQPTRVGGENSSKRTVEYSPYLLDNQLKKQNYLEQEAYMWKEFLYGWLVIGTYAGRLSVCLRVWADIVMSD